ncbi:UNVERIFIED_CONTAM: Vacuolar iron transporter4 [Sesamum latifolium]|uniref:Vacuolar iron transporter n=1 Tax=Sesamum latifolium TaxID=2727402 RepID=A0AAW2XJP0_9LAMI
MSKSLQSLKTVQTEPMQLSAVPEVEEFDYSKRAQWLRAAVLGANDGLVSIASLMMGVGAVKDDVKVMILTGGSPDEEGKRMVENDEEDVEKEKLPNPFQAALASALAFSLGAIVPLLAAAFIADYKVRLAVVVVATTAALVGFGGVGAVLGRTKVVRSCGRVVVGGWMAMGITFGLTKLLSSRGLEM